MLRIPRPRSNFGSQTIRNFSTLESNTSYDKFSGNNFETICPPSYISSFSVDKEYQNFGRSTSDVNSLNKSVSSDCSTPIANIWDDGGCTIIGENLVIPGYFGPRKCVYLDQTASNRAVEEIEDFLRIKVLPIYANTHTTNTYCAAQITTLREESRGIIRAECGCNEDDVIIFTGSGTTTGIHKFLGSITNQRKDGFPPPIVIVGPFEHHSNILPWREVTDRLITVTTNSAGFVDLKELEGVLKSIRGNKITKSRLVIGAFSAGSNVTGALSDDVAITALLHKYGAFSFWDYAAAAPHVDICMNPKTGNDSLDKLCRKDAISFSGHKFLGGPQTPGVLIAKKSVFRNPIPHGHGGGTVVFVTQARHRYLNDIVERNEGGTPDIVGSIRLGLVFQLRKLCGIGSIVQNEGEFTRQVIKAWKKIPEIIILGPTDEPRLPIISFLIYNKRMDCYLHHNFVTTLLNDLFGIQSRSGCMCAGPYGQLLLGIDDKLAKVYEQMLSVPIRNSNGDSEYGVVFKPGFTRISLPYHASQQEISYMIEAVKLIATEGWKFLPFYQMNTATGTFKFASNLNQPNTLNNRISLKTFGSERATPCEKSIDLAPDFEVALSYAKHLLDSVEQILMHSETTISNEAFPQEWHPFRWFLLPSEAFFLIRYGGKIPKYRKNLNKLPFIPKTNYKTNKWNWIPGSIPNSVRKTMLDDPTKKELALCNTLKLPRSLK